MNQKLVLEASRCISKRAVREFQIFVNVETIDNKCEASDAGRWVELNGDEQPVKYKL